MKGKNWDQLPSILTTISTDQTTPLQTTSLSRANLQQLGCHSYEMVGNQALKEHALIRLRRLGQQSDVVQVYAYYISGAICAEQAKEPPVRKRPKQPPTVLTWRGSTLKSFPECPMCRQFTCSRNKNGLASPIGMSSILITIMQSAAAQSCWVSF